ncbi:MAG TPA: DUF4956 domain-containing protein [Bacilli bacterium]|nr:DUF4956 domain-containing protein [Bacilli bacterium]
MSIIDAIKSSVLGQFNETLSISSLLISLVISFGIAIFIIFIYKKTYSGVIYSKSFSLSLILLSMVTSIIIKTINSNLALSLGMVGALSIVRFRTAIKEPLDTIFMFWAIATGIMVGAGLYIPSIIASIVLGLLFFLSYSYIFKPTNRYLLILKYDAKVNSKIEQRIKDLPKCKLRTKTIFENQVEATYEVDLKDDIKGNIVHKFANLKGVNNASLVNYQNDFGE